jgi:hypothetical protein
MLAEFFDFLLDTEKKDNNTVGQEVIQVTINVQRVDESARVHGKETDPDNQLPQSNAPGSMGSIDVHIRVMFSQT